jgi:hypothetical protein
VEKVSPPKKWGPRAAGRLDADEYCKTLSFHWNVLRDRWWRYSFFLVNKVHVFALGILLGTKYGVIKKDCLSW